MKTMKIEKHLLFANVIQAVKQLEVKDGLTYQHEMEGIRAIGPLYIQGEYVTSEGKQESFQEVLDMDVLAPNAKLTQEPFYLKVEEYQGVVDHEGVCVYITLSIYGIGDNANTEVIQAPVDVPEPMIEQPVQQSEGYKEETVMAVESDTEDEIKQQNIDDAEFEDLFEDADTTYTSYRMVVARGNDTYDSIAQRYQVEVSQLRDMNHNKDVYAKTLVILPPNAA